MHSKKSSLSEEHPQCMHHGAYILLAYNNDQIKSSMRFSTKTSSIICTSCVTSKTCALQASQHYHFIQDQRKFTLVVLIPIVERPTNGLFLTKVSTMPILRRISIVICKLQYWKPPSSQSIYVISIAENALCTFWPIVHVCRIWRPWTIIVAILSLSLSLSLSMHVCQTRRLTILVLVHKP